MKRNYIITLSIVFFTWFFSATCFAEVVSPVAQLQHEANRMVGQLEANKARLSNLNVVRGIVNSIFLPNVALDRMSASVVGQPWRTATPEQRAQFEKEFSHLVTTTYAAALSSYNDDKVLFKPFRGDYTTRQTATVNSVIVRKSGQRIAVDYDLARAGDRWKVYDFSIENVSMVQSYRSQFAGILQQGGMPALLTQMHNHNAATQ